MRIKKDFVIREICGEYLITPEGQENIDFSKIINLNESSAYLWKNIVGTDFDSEQLAQLLVKEYDVDFDKALTDSEAIIQKWYEIGLLEK